MTSQRCSRFLLRRETGNTQVCRTLPNEASCPQMSRFLDLDEFGEAARFMRLTNLEQLAAMAQAYDGTTHLHLFIFILTLQLWGFYLFLFKDAFQPKYRQSLDPGTFFKDQRSCLKTTQQQRRCDHCNAQAALVRHWTLHCENSRSRFKSC